MKLKMTMMLCTLMMLSSIPADAQVKTPKEEKKELKVGDVAPDWEMKASDGKTYKLSDYKDKKAVVVAWYPKALTGG